MNKKFIYLSLFLITISCTTLILPEEYKTSFKILETPAEYIAVDNIEAHDEYIEITFTNNSDDIVKIIWENTTLNLSKIVTKEFDIELIDKPSVYKNKYKELFIGPYTSQKLSIYPLNNVYKYKKIDTRNNTETYFYALSKIKYPVNFNFNIIKATINTKKPFNILILRTPIN